MSTSAREAVASGKPLLRVSSLSAWYGELRAIYDVSLELRPGEVLAVIGANGAGKSTLLRSLVGLMNQGARAHLRGVIEFDGERIDPLTPDAIVDRGLTLVPEGRRLFSRMSVEDNLLAGAFLPRCRADIPARLESVFSIFPRLRERRRQVVSQMSGGEQQMVAIGRALMSSPRLIAFDELSLGLSPAMVDEIYRNLDRIIGEGKAVIIVEQDLKRALSACTRFCVMLEGSLVLEGEPGKVPVERITAAYFGAQSDGSGAPSGSTTAAAGG